MLALKLKACNLIPTSNIIWVTLK